MRLTVALVVLGAISFFYRLGEVGLIGPDESRYAEVSRGMLERGDWVTPELGGEVWLHKPPLFYWLAAASMWVLGETEAAVRLPSAVAALATCLSIGLLGARLFDSGSGIRSAVVLASSLGMVVYGRAAIMDSLLTFFLTLGLGAYLYYSIVERSRIWLAIAYAAFGAAVLAKGPVGIVLPLLIIVLFEVVTHRRVLPKPRSLLTATASFLAVVAPWNIEILNAQGWEYVESFLFQHNLDRFLTTVHRHQGPFYYYLPILVVALVPWTAFIPAAVSSAFRKKDAPRLFLFLWICVPLVFFSLAGSKLPGYILPILPPLALLVGTFWTDEFRTEEPGAGLVGQALAFQVGLSIVLGAAAIYGFWSRLPAIVEGGWVLGPLVIALSALTYLLGRRRPRVAFGSLVASSAILTLTLVLYVAPLIEPYKSLKTLASMGFAELAPHEQVICYKNFYPQAHFYTQDRLGEIWTLEEFRIRVLEWGRIVTLTEPHRFQELVDEPSLRTRVIAECGGKILAEASPAPPGPRSRDDARP
jgi:4-amino-4-deoxy-L-arabinose transferase-like glycosyltransferase